MKVEGPGGRVAGREVGVAGRRRAEPAVRRLRGARTGLAAVQCDRVLAASCKVGGDDGHVGVVRPQESDADDRGIRGHLELERAARRVPQPAPLVRPVLREAPPSLAHAVAPGPVVALRAAPQHHRVVEEGVAEADDLRRGHARRAVAVAAVAVAVVARGGAARLEAPLVGEPVGDELLPGPGRMARSVEIAARRRGPGHHRHAEAPARRRVPAVCRDAGTRLVRLHDHDSRPPAEEDAQQGLEGLAVDVLRRVVVGVMQERDVEAAAVRELRPELPERGGRRVAADRPVGDVDGDARVRPREPHAEARGERARAVVFIYRKGHLARGARRRCPGRVRGLHVARGQGTAEDEHVERTRGAVAQATEYPVPPRQIRAPRDRRAVRRSRAQRPPRVAAAGPRG